MGPPLSVRAVADINEAEEVLVEGAPYYGISVEGKERVKRALALIRDAREALYQRPML